MLIKRSATPPPPKKKTKTKKKQKRTGFKDNLNFCHRNTSGCVVRYSHPELPWGAGLLQYKKRLLLRCIHHFISELIYNMDDMRISGTEPLSVIFSHTK